MGVAAIGAQRLFAAFLGFPFDFGRDFGFGLGLAAVFRDLVAAAAAVARGACGCAAGFGRGWAGGASRFRCTSVNRG
jgi:hypothetical protein